MMAIYTLRRASAAVVALLTLTGCASEAIVAEPSAPSGLHVVSERISDEAIRQDRDVIHHLRQRLQALNDSGRWPLDNYHVCKAQAWIDFAEIEYTDNDRGTVVESALDQARILIDAMQGDATVPQEAALLEESMVVRQDLWSLVAQTKKDRDNDCNGCLLAKLEVRLVAAGHDQKELGWRHAESNLLAAERFARGINEKNHCPVAKDDIVERDADVGAPEDLKVPVVVHFAYDSASIGDETGKVLVRVAQIMRQYPEITVRLMGHADSRGGQAYNERLSERRAAAVRAHLSEAGVAEARMTGEGLGKSQPLNADAPLIKAYALDRRVELRFENLPPLVKKDGRQQFDLQPER